MAAPGDCKKSLIDLQLDNSLLHPEFDGYKLSLEKVPIFEHSFETDVSHVEPTSEQYSFQHVRLFGLHNHLYGDPWQTNDVYYFNNLGKLIRNTWEATERRFEHTEVWCEDENAGTTGRLPGDYNFSLSLDCKDKAFILDGRTNGTLSIISTGDRSKGSRDWGKEKIAISSIPAGIILNSAWCVEGDGNFHCLLQSVVDASTIDELKVASKEPGASFATMLQWITIGKSDCVGEQLPSYEIVAQRHICVHGPIDYAAIEPGAAAIYVASQKEAFYAQDTTRPITPMLVRALRKPLHYMWQQTEEHITLRFTLPWTAHTEELEVHHKHEDGKFSVSVTTEGSTHEVISGQTSLPLAEQSASQCTVIDGRVEVRLQKGEAGQKWEEFISGDTLGTPTPDPEQVKEAEEALRHLTSDKQEEGEVMAGFNCGQLEECDAPPSDSAMLVRLAADCHTPTHRVQLSAHQWVCGARMSPGSAPGLVLRHDVDALAWQPEPPGDTWKITHVGSFPAFGYVQASKEQKKFIVCPPDLGFVAICESSHHIYLYHQPSPLASELRNRHTGRRVASVAKQQVVRTPETMGQILGACAVNKLLFVLAKNSIAALPLD